MSIAKLSDVVVRWLMPQTTAAACIPPDGCGACANAVTRCVNHVRTTKYFQTLAYNCLGQCVVHRTQECRVVTTSC
jgi:hypothetical protein